MTAPIANIDNTTLLNLTPNLDIGDIADPALRLVYFQYLNVYIQSITSAFNGFVAGGAVGSVNLADLSVLTAKIAELAVTTSKIADGAVTAGKFDPALMTTDVTLNLHRLNTVLDHPNGSVTLPKLASDVVQKINQVYSVEREVINLKAVSTLANRVDGASGLFYDLMDGLNGGSAGKIDLTTTNIPATTSIGATTVTVNSVTGFAVGQEVTLFDDVNLERPIISAINTGTKVITFTIALTKAYKANAQLCRSSVVQDTTNKLLKFNGWSSIVTVAVTSPTTVVASAYDTSGNGGRKVVRLNSGNLFAVMRNGTTDFRVYKSTDKGTTWTLLVTVTESVNDVSLATNGTQLYVLSSFSTTGAKFRRYDESGVLQGTVMDVDSVQTAIGNCSLAINSAGTELHAAWSSKNATYSNSFDIRYAKGTIAGDGTVTWGAVAQLTTDNVAGNDNTNPSVVVKSNNNPSIAYQQANAVNRFIWSLNWNGSAWVAVNIYTAGSTSYNQQNPSAVVSPDGTIHVAWFGSDATDTTQSNIRYSKSTDGGVTWTAMMKLTSGNTYDQFYPSITSDKNNNIYAIWYGIDSTLSTSIGNIRRIIWNGTTWGSITTLTSNTTADASYPQTLSNYTDFTDPLVIYKDTQVVGVKFRGTWASGVSTPVLVEDVRYNITPPSNVSSIVAWVDHDADANYSIASAASFQASGGNESFTALTKTTAAIDGTHNEDQFVGSGTANAKATLRLTLTRNSTALVKNISQITGAVGA